MRGSHDLLNFSLSSLFSSSGDNTIGKKNLLIESLESIEAATRRYLRSSRNVVDYFENKPGT